MGLELAPVPGDKEITPRQMIAIGIVTAGAFFVLHEINDKQDSRVEKTEACVSDLIGRDVSLTTEPRTGRILRPEAIYDEISVCLESGGDPAEAKILLDE